MLHKSENCLSIIDTNCCYLVTVVLSGIFLNELNIRRLVVVIAVCIINQMISEFVLFVNVYLSFLFELMVSFEAASGAMFVLLQIL